MDNDKNTSNFNRELRKDGDNEPVSRFWACFFSASIFALVWTFKLKKTRLWILLFLGINIGMGVLIIGSVGDELMLTDDEYNRQYFESESSYIQELIILEIIFSILSLLTYIPFIYFMFKWTTEYNLATCGYKNKKEWKKSRLKDNS